MKLIALLTFLGIVLYLYLTKETTDEILGGEDET